jgi:hypothetical protein
MGWMRTFFLLSVGISFLFAAEMGLLPNWQNYFSLWVRNFLNGVERAREFWGPMILRELRLV